MSTAVWRDLGSVDGACTVCGAHGTLTLGEARFAQTLLERLRREHRPPRVRFITCSECAWRWTARADDTAADGVRRRRATARPESVRVGDEPLTASRTVLPHQRDGRRSRDGDASRG